MAEAAGPIVALGSAALRSIWNAIQATLEVEIRNRCGLELASPVYFCDGATCDIPLDQSAAPDTSIRTRFRVDLTQITFQGAILYELRATTTSPNETGTDNTMTETNENTPISMQLLVT
jgi:hypothetical protein